jgi:hypothetical protein
LYETKIFASLVKTISVPYGEREHVCSLLSFKEIVSGLKIFGVPFGF